MADEKRPDEWINVKHDKTGATAVVTREALENPYKGLGWKEVSVEEAAKAAQKKYEEMKEIRIEQAQAEAEAAEAEAKAADAQAKSAQAPDQKSDK